MNTKIMKYICMYVNNVPSGGGSKGRLSDLHCDSEIGLATNPAYAIHRHGTQPTPGPGSSSISATGYEEDNNSVYTTVFPSNEGHPRSYTIPVPEYDYHFLPSAETLGDLYIKTDVFLMSPKLHMIMIILQMHAHL